jgi:hypothetical protein
VTPLVSRSLLFHCSWPPLCPPAPGFPILIPNAPALAPVATPVVLSRPAEAPAFPRLWGGGGSRPTVPRQPPELPRPGAQGDILFVFPWQLVVGDVSVPQPLGHLLRGLRSFLGLRLLLGTVSSSAHAAWSLLPSPLCPCRLSCLGAHRP